MQLKIKLPKAEIILDKRRAYLDGTYPVKVRITFQREQKYYKTGHALTDKQFKRLSTGERFTQSEKDLRDEIYNKEKDAIAVLKSLPAFSWIEFERKYISNHGAWELVADAFNKAIARLKKEERFGTASSYNDAKNSITKDNPNLRFTDITVSFLNSYEQNLIKQNYSRSTVGIYLRPLRALFNEGIGEGGLSESIYPFRRNASDKSKYQIPTSENIKRALNQSELKKLIEYKATGTPERFLSYWLFQYYMGGLNPADLCRIKFENIHGEYLQFVRTKTKRNKKEVLISLYLLPEAREIIEKFGNKEGFIFPLFDGSEKPENERLKINQVAKNISRHVNKIAKEVGVSFKVTNQSARHSHATRLRDSGVPIALISEQLGHSNVSTTTKYLSKTESSIKKEITRGLTEF